MPDHSAPSDALSQIYAVAAQRWKQLDAEKRREQRARAGGSSTRGKLSAVDRRRVLRLRRAGATLREISNQVGCSVSTVRRVLQDTAHDDSQWGGRNASELERASSRARALGQRIARLEYILAALSEALQILGESRPARSARKRSI